MSVSVKLPDGSQRELEDGASVLDLAKSIGPGLAKATLAAVVDGRTTTANVPLPAEGEVELRLLTKKDPFFLAHLIHGCLTGLERV